MLNCTTNFIYTKSNFMPQNPQNPKLAPVVKPAVKKLVPKKPPTNLQPKTPNKKSSFKDFILKLSEIGTVSLKEKLFFAENFRVMVKAGLSISEALNTLSMQTSNKKFKKVLSEIKKGVAQGSALADMLAKFPKIFPEYFINMVSAGEKSGKLEENLEQLALQMKKDHELLSKVRGAMIYPSVIIVATIGITILMFIYVIPSVLSVFDEFSLNLPIATRILIGISKTLTNYGLFVGIGFIALATIIVFYSKTKNGKHFFHRMLLGLWIIGPIAKKINLARFSRTLSSLLKTDIPIIESFKITASILGNVHYKDACLNASKNLEKGIPIHKILTQYAKFFPPLLTQMVSVGEKSGTTEVLLSELADFYESEVSEITKNLSSIIEPILIVFLGGAVGFIAFAIISPIYSLSQSV